jgi:hypothetical protein
MHVGRRQNVHPSPPFSSEDKGTDSYRTHGMHSLAYCTCNRTPTGTEVILIVCQAPGKWWLWTTTLCQVLDDMPSNHSPSARPTDHQSWADVARSKPSNGSIRRLSPIIKQ